MCACVSQLHRGHKGNNTVDRERVTIIVMTIMNTFSKQQMNPPKYLEIISQNQMVHSSILYSVIPSGGSSSNHKASTLVIIIIIISHLNFQM